MHCAPCNVHSVAVTERAAGILLHPTSLPGGTGVGDLGAEARRFVDWLVEAGLSYWQLLPLVAVDAGGSPYNGLSAMAGNGWLIDLRALADEGLLDAAALDLPVFPDARVDFARVGPWKDERLREAAAALRGRRFAALRAEVDRYRERNAFWLGDYALFRALRDRYGGAPWTEWGAGDRDRDPGALERARAELAGPIDGYVVEQFLFDRQWSALRRYAAERGVRIIGDIPIFVAHDSADVWSHRALFELDATGRSTVVAGVPPDYFSETGQRWGNPLYDWSYSRSWGYRWWIERFRRTLEWVDLVRVDHFRGFESYWEVPAEEETATHGVWRPGPGRELFDAVREALGAVPVIAEDLGLITPEVEALRDELGLPGMRVLQFAFDGDPANPHLPENHPAHAVAYTGTHDNDTVLGWWAAAPAEARERVGETEEPHRALLRMVFGSPAEIAIVPAQDVLGLGSEARMNRPGTVAGNWGWRMRSGQLSAALAERIRGLARDTGRLPHQR